jgi:hypothetical protein
MKLACAFEMMCASGEREPCSAAAATSGHCGDATSNELTALDCNGTSGHCGDATSDELTALD